MSLTDVKVRTAKAQEKAYKLSDEKGLFLFTPLVCKFGYHNLYLVGLAVIS
ncbi:MAG: hypothetical protein Q8R79_03465 [Legionellaceae bacterium]|nr:hypothetical protein [Legionellaceae bacterium]